MQWRFEDSRCRIAVGSGDVCLLKATEYCGIYAFDTSGSSGTAQCGDAPFLAHCILVTVEGTWKARTPGGIHCIDRATAVVGEAGALCPGGTTVQNVRRYLLTLEPSGLDHDMRLFDDNSIDAAELVRFARLADAADGNDAFDTLIYSAFDEASVASLGRKVRDSRIRMQRLKRFIERHAFEPITLYDMATELGLSPFTMVRLFRAAAGTTPYAYLLEIRYQRARALLQRGTESVAAIARATGFDQHSHFTRWFTRRAGVPPTVYRAQHVPHRIHS